MILILYHGAPVISSVYDKASIILSAGYGGQGETICVCGAIILHV